MNALIEYIKDTIDNGFHLPLEIYGFGMLLLLVLVFSFIKLGLKRKKEYQSVEYLIVTQLLKSLIVFLFIVLSIAFALFVFDYNKYFVLLRYGLDLIVVTTFLSLAILLVFIKVSVNVKRNLKKYIKLPISKTEKFAYLLKLKKAFAGTKMWMVLIFASFLILIATFKVQYKAFVSVVLDNSGSTTSFIDYGREFLSNAIGKVYPGTEFLVSYFKNIENDNSLSYKTSIEEILNETDYNNLACENLYFGDALSAKTFIQDFELPDGGGSPIYETIWSNHLFAKEKTFGKTYDRKIFILLTDGADNLYFNKKEAADLVGFNILDEEDNASSETITDFYNDIVIINLGDNEDEYMFENIDPDLIYDGLDKINYYNALKAAIQGISKRDWNFVYVIMIVVLIPSVISLFVKF